MLGVITDRMEKGEGEMGSHRYKRYDILVDAEGAGANNVLVLSLSRSDCSLTHGTVLQRISRSSRGKK